MVDAPIYATKHIDSLIPRKVPEISEQDISKHLRDAGFTLIFKDLQQPAAQAYVKEIDGVEVEIEFLTDSIARHNRYDNVTIAGVVAQPLSYLRLSLQTTKMFRTYSGINGIVVAPGAWMFHKGLTFVKRRNASKKLKDLYGIWYVATELGEFSEHAVNELLVLGTHHPKWWKTFREHLISWQRNASPLDWSQLEAQDSYGRLKKLSFEHIVKTITSDTSACDPQRHLFI